MTNKQLIFLPLMALGLLSCNPNTSPKPLSYNDAISYIKKNAKGEKMPNEGYVEYKCSHPENTQTIQDLEGFGVIGVSSQGNNKIKDDLIQIYLTRSASPSGMGDLPLMYLNETNFKEFVGKQSGFSYSLYQNQFIIYHIQSDDLYYTRYYNTDIRLTRFEVHSTVSGNEYDVTQTYSY